MFKPRLKIFSSFQRYHFFRYIMHSNVRKLRYLTFFHILYALYDEINGTVGKMRKFYEEIYTFIFFSIVMQMTESFKN